MNVVMIGHASIRTFKDPQGMDHDRYELRVHNKSSGIIKEWCDLVGFANYETIGVEDANSGRFKVADTGKRLLYFTRERGFEAKSRFSLPKSMELNWPTFYSELQKAKASNRDILVEEIQALFDSLPESKKDSLKEKVGLIVESEHDTKKLEQTIRRLKDLTK